MPRRPVAFTRISGLGPLPRLFEAEEGGRALRRLLTDGDLHLDGLPPSTPIPFVRMNDVFNRAARLSGDPLFPVRVARAMRPEDYGPFVDFAFGASSLGAGIRRLCRLTTLQSNATRFDFRIVGQDAAWTLHYLAAHGQPIDHHALHILVPMISFIRRYAGPTASPVALFLASPRDSTHRAMEEALDVSLHAGADAFGVAFPAEWLSLAGAWPAPRITIPEVIAHYRQKSLPTSISGTVAALVVPIVGHADVDLDVIARKLNLSRRTLQQRLNEEGSSFRDIILTARMEKAKEKMLAGADSIAQVALAVGYSDQAHFHRAFKGATGVTPQEFRRQSLGGRLIAAE